MSNSLSPADILGPGGRIAARLPGYEHRSEQLEMADAVAKAIRQKKHLIVEAGTGVGKSFAYLVPAILATGTSSTATAPPNPSAAREPRGLRVVIATHTIALQEQLIHKDIPFLRSVTPVEFSAVLVKGRSNYISLRRMGAAQARAVSLFNDDEEHAQLRDLKKWADETSEGSRSDLSFRPLPQVWDEIQSESGNCLGKHCPTYKECFYYAARRRVHNAQLMVVNHALFFSDLQLRQSGASILPDYDVVIFDEAHTVEGVAGDHLGLAVSSGQFDYLFNKLYNDRTQRGLLVHHRWTDCQQLVDECRIRADEFFFDVQQYLDQHGRSNGRIESPPEIANTLSESLEKLANLIRQKSDKLPPEGKADCSSASEKLAGLASSLRMWLDQKSEGSVFWVDTQEGRRRKISLAAAPIDVGPALREMLFETVPTVIMTSATLAVGKKNSFDFFKARIGLTQADTLMLGSPFDYKKQARIVLPLGMPDPSEGRAYDRQAFQMIRKYVAQTDGRAFVLFTSYTMLRAAAAALAPWLAERNLALYSQADGLPRTQMLDKFKANPRSVLFGTDSFWQGVDVPGNALTNVIITKLPFSVPDRPLLEAKLDQIRESGGNPFRDYQLPEAIIKLKQGFGRLIRTKDDTGQVVILDPRILTKPYGKTFLESLPDCEVVRERVGDEAGWAHAERE